MDNPAFDELALKPERRGTAVAIDWEVGYSNHFTKKFRSFQKHPNLKHQGRQIYHFRGMILKRLLI